MSPSEINEAVARKLGWIGGDSPAGGELWEDLFGHSRTPDEIPNYSMDINTAWNLVAEMQKRGDVELFAPLGSWDYSCTVTMYEDTEVTLANEFGKTMPLAICFCFLALPPKEVW